MLTTMPKVFFLLGKKIKANLDKYSNKILFFQAYEKELADENESNTQEMRENQTKSISELETLKKDLNDIFRKKLKAEKKRNSVKNQLDENILPKLTELQNALSSRSPEGASNGLATESEEKVTLQQV